MKGQKLTLSLLFLFITLLLSTTFVLAAEENPSQPEPNPDKPEIGDEYLKEPSNQLDPEPLLPDEAYIDRLSSLFQKTHSSSEPEQPLLFEGTHPQTAYNSPSTTKVDINTTTLTSPDLTESCSLQSYINNVRNALVAMYEPCSAEDFKRNVEFTLENFIQRAEYRYLMRSEVMELLRSEAVMAIWSEESGVKFGGKEIEELGQVIEVSEKEGRRFVRYVLPRSTPEFNDNIVTAHLDIILLDLKAGDMQTLVLAYKSKIFAKITDPTADQEKKISYYQYLKKGLLDIMVMRFGIEGSIRTDLV